MQEESAREPVRSSLYLKMVMGEKSAIPNPRFLRSSSIGHSLDLVKERFFFLRNMGYSTASSSAPPNITPCGTVARNEERGSVATETPLTGYEPNLFDTPEDYDGIDEIFRDTNFTQLIYDSDGQYPDPAEVDNEHLRSECASPLQMQKKGSKTDLTETHHPHEESLLVSALLNSARTGKRGSVLNVRGWSQGLEDEILMSALQVQREQILAEAKY